MPAGGGLDFKSLKMKIYMAMRYSIEGSYFLSFSFGLSGTRQESAIQVDMPALGNIHRCRTNQPIIKPVKVRISE